MDEPAFYTLVARIELILSNRMALSHAKIVAELRRVKDQGIKKDEMLAAMTWLRERPSSDITDDRIFEAMDFVDGFCSSNMRVYGEQ